MEMEVYMLKSTMAFHMARANPVQSLLRRGEALDLHKILLSAFTFSCPPLLLSQASPSEVLNNSQRTPLQLEVTQTLPSSLPKTKVLLWPSSLTEG